MNYNHDEFNIWLRKSKCTELDIIKCRKMQSVNLMESENTFGIKSIQICGFINNDLVKLGGEIKKKYDETDDVYYTRVFDILSVCCSLMDSVNQILVDEGAWSSDYFINKLNEWFKDKLSKG